MCCLNCGCCFLDCGHCCEGQAFDCRWMLEFDLKRAHWRTTHCDVGWKPSLYFWSCIACQEAAVVQMLQSSTAVGSISYKNWEVALPGTGAAFHFWSCGRSWKIWVRVCHWWCYQSSSLLCSVLCRDKTDNTSVVIPWSLGWQRWRRQWCRIQWRRGRRNTARELQHAPWWWTMPCRRIHRL